MIVRLLTTLILVFSGGLPVSLAQGSTGELSSTDSQAESVPGVSDVVDAPVSYTHLTLPTIYSV